MSRDPTLLDRMRRKQLEIGDAFYATLPAALRLSLESEFSDYEREADVRSRRDHWRIGGGPPLEMARFRAVWTVNLLSVSMRHAIIEHGTFFDASVSAVLRDRRLILKRSGAKRSLFDDYFVPIIVDGVAARWDLADELWCRFSDALNQGKLRLIGLKAVRHPAFGHISLTAVAPLW